MPAHYLATCATKTIYLRSIPLGWQHLKKVEDKFFNKIGQCRVGHLQVGRVKIPLLKAEMAVIRIVTFIPFGAWM